MCGIAGIVGAPERGLLERMLRRLAPRGPDGQGVAELGDMSLGSVRLSLLDLERGHQPFRSDDGRLTLVYNGEIYNHAALREELRGLGAAFVGRSDTEVLLRAYEAWGSACPSALEGMFAFAVSDGARLFLARDYFGQKPLFYWISPDRRRLLFASEIKALLEDPSVPRTVSWAALLELSAFGMPLAERTFFEGIEQLPPGGTLTVTRSPDGTLDLRPGSHSAPLPAALPRDEDELVDLLIARLEGSVKEQLLADHPVGIYLSSGLDSALVATIAAQAGLGPIHTFTFADDPENPDVITSRALSGLLGTSHHEALLDADSLAGSLPRSVAVHEAPTRVTLVEATAPFVRRHVKAALCGEGADELFAGYPIHAAPLRWVQRCVSAYNRIIATGQARTRHCAQAKALLGRLTAGAPDAIRDAVYQLFLRDELHQAHLKLWDHGSMAAGLEVRLPYLSKPIREFALGAPWELKVRGDTCKYLLRRAATRLLPRPIVDEIVHRRKLAAPSALHRTQRALGQSCQRWIPEGHAAAHPYRIFAEPGEQLVAIDLFVYLFVVRGGDVPEDFTVEALYARHLDELQAALRSSAAPEILGAAPPLLANQAGG
ncbi:asparagine synthase (glutamine-hydrolyzing) [Sorangium sp. So ce375]|uniref:asparagine synthase (glutamine-hydrolyzing) n=1 Tax=Sorangium sp. So ce375 TaxID=3133306 RepID=UPI003F5B2177